MNYWVIKMSEEINFRLADPADAQKVLVLLKQLQSETDTFLVDSNLDELTPEMEAKQIGLINQSYRNLMALAVLDDQPVGIVTVDGLGANDGEVGIAVLSAYQGYTLGTNLLELAIDWAKTYSQLATLKLAVFKDNAAAVHLYQKLGFNQTGTESRNDRIILKMSLPVKK